MKQANPARINDQLRAELFATLSERREILLRQLDHMNRELPEGATDAADQPNEKQMARVQHDQLLVSIRNTDLAIARVEHLDFGSCEVCAEPIVADRLRAIPETTRCTNCANVP